MSSCEPCDSILGNDAELLNWLEVSNLRYAAEGVEHRLRPFQAVSDFTRERRCTLTSKHPIVRAIFDWFYENSPPNSHQVGSMYTGVFLFDTAFWQIQIPLILGEVKVNALHCLNTMPPAVKKNLSSSKSDSSAYVRHWLNCMDYGYGHMEGCNGRLTARARKFFSAAHAELLGANSQLLEHRPNVKAILGLRMATEIFLKGILIQECDLSDEALQKISHKLESASAKCAEVTKKAVFEEISSQLSVFPPVSARYEDTYWPIERVWQAAMLTQLTAATVMRRYTDSNLQATLWPTREAS